MLVNYQRRTNSSPPNCGDLPETSGSTERKFLLDQTTLTMPSARVSGPTAHPKVSEMKADHETKADVDWMILDYLTCLAINQTLSIEKISQSSENLENPVNPEEVDWLVDAVGGKSHGRPDRWHTDTDKRVAFRSLTQSDSESSLPQDLDIKIRVLAVGHQIRHYMPVQEHPSREGCSALSEIGIQFMDLCAAAVHKVSETRWFDIGAQFMVQAMLEEQCERNTPSDILSKLYAWAPNDQARYSKWLKIRQSYTNEFLNHDGISAPRNDLKRKFPFEGFRSVVLGFLIDLMTTLDAPLLVQLERGQIGCLSRDETQRLRERIGLK